MFCYVFTHPFWIWRHAETHVLSAECALWAELGMAVIVHYGLREEQFISSQGLEHVERYGAPVAKIVV